MAGFLAPTINEAGASGGGVSTPIDTSVGNALSNIGDIFRMATARNGEGPTQTDRDRDALRPVAEQLARIKKQRDAGMSPARANAQATQVITEALTFMPDKEGQIKALATTMLGTEFLEPTKDPATETLNAITSELSDLSDPRNADLLLRVVEASQTAEGFNEDIFRAEGLRAIAEKNAEDAQLMSLKTRADIAVATNTLNNAEQDQTAEIVFQRMTQRADLRIQNLIKTFAASGENFDRNTIIQTLLKEETQLTNEFNRNAADLFILDNIKDKFGGVVEAVRPLTNVREMLQNMREEDFQAFEERVRNDTTGFADALEAAGVPFGTNPEIQKNGATYLTAQHIAGIRKAAKEVHEEAREFMQPNPFYQKTENNGFEITPEAEEKGTDTITTEAGTAVQQSLSDSEAKIVVRSGLAGFYAYGDLAEVDDFITSTAVKNFAVGLETMTNRGTPITEETFDRVYNPTKFFSIYNNIQALGGPSANLLENAVRKHLAFAVNVRERVVSQNIDRDELPNLKLTFNGSNYDLILEGATSEFELVLLRELNKRNLSRDYGGIQKLHKAIRGQPGGAEVELSRGMQALFTDIDGHMKFLNKIVKTANGISEGMAGQVLPPTGTSNDPAIINDEESFRKLEEGVPYRLQYEDGSLSPPMIRGQEPFIRG